MDTIEEALHPLPDRPPRHCPVCGARVAEGAKTCLMCGTALDEDVAASTPESTDAASPTTRGLSRQHILILAGVAILILVGSLVLGWNLSQGTLGPEPPTFTPTVTATPTITPTPTATPTPTITPTPTATPTPIPPETYVVQPGDSLLSIAINFNRTVEELKAFNDLETDIIVAGRSLLIPPPTPTPGPTPTPRPDEPDAAPGTHFLYTVQTGDTLSTIAQEHGIRLSDLRAANDIPQDSETIRAGQVMIIPLYTPTPEVTPIVGGGTPTPRPLYPAPTMLYPPEGTVFSGPDANIVLQWVSVGILQEREYYKIELIVPTQDGKTSRTYYSRATAWRVPVELYPPLDIPERVFEWRVSVARQITSGAEPDYRDISQMNRRRPFTWATD